MPYPELTFEQRMQLCKRRAEQTIQACHSYISRLGKISEVEAEVPTLTTAQRQDLRAKYAAVYQELQAMADTVPNNPMTMVPTADELQYLFPDDIP